MASQRSILGFLIFLGCSGSLILMAEESRWSEKRAWDWYVSVGEIRGCNYLPRTAVNMTEMWQAETFDPTTITEELGWAAQAGYNNVRVYIQFLVWQHDREGFMRYFERFLTIADTHKIRVMPVLFCDCSFSGKEPYLGKQDKPVPGVHNSGWVPSPGLKRVTDRAAWPALEAYVKDIVGSFGQDQRVLIWDLYNEPGNSGMGQKSLPLVEAAFRWARQVRPSQPITVGPWRDFEGTMSQRIFALSDIISFHAYDPPEGVKKKIAICERYRRPIVCTEWLKRQDNNTFTSILPLFGEHHIGGYHWGLVAGKIQTYMPWGSKKGDPIPKLWQHDVMHADGRAYDTKEFELLRQFRFQVYTQGIGTIGDRAELPPLKPLFDYPLRDPSICVVEGTYYLTGTTGYPSWWQTNTGIRMWKSRDLQHWDFLGEVWNIDWDGTWAKQIKEGRRAAWAPEVHYLKGTFWLTYSMNYGGCGLLKSLSGKAEGPYRDVKTNGPLTDQIDASLFQDDDGTVYWVYQNGKIARMKDDMTGLAEKPRVLKPANHHQVGFEGAFLTKHEGRYYLAGAEFNSYPSLRKVYDCMIASARNLYGPYTNRYVALPHAGHNMLFCDTKGRWWSTFFGNDGAAPFRERPAIFRIEFGADGKVSPRLEK